MCGVGNLISVLGTEGGAELRLCGSDMLIVWRLLLLSVEGCCFDRLVIDSDWEAVAEPIATQTGVNVGRNMPQLIIWLSSHVRTVKI